MADVAASATDAVPSCRREPGVHAEGHPVAFSFAAATIIWKRAAAEYVHADCMLYVDSVSESLWRVRAQVRPCVGRAAPEPSLDLGEEPVRCRDLETR